ncbi:MAG: hypothetical protein WHS46_01320 [Desulfosoma sp.]
MASTHGAQPTVFQKLGLVVGLILILCVLDGILDILRTPKREIRLYPGMEKPVAGKTEAAIPDLRWLTYETTAPGVSLQFLEATGRLWRAQLTVEPTTPEGSYTLRVFLHGEKPEEAAENPLYSLHVFADAQLYHASQRSLVQRYLGVSPWVGAACAFPILVLCFWLSYKAGDKMDQELRRQGMAPVYRTLQNKDKTITVFFGLGSTDGLAPGDTVKIVTHDGRVLGTAQVESVSLNDAQARLQETQRLPAVVYVSRL